jgi:hypothetical protein
MALDWFQRKKESGEIEINDEGIKNVIKPQLDSMKTEFESTIDSKLAPVLEYFTNQKKEKEDAIRAAEQRKKQDDLEIQPEDYIIDPQGVIDKKLKPLQERSDIMAAILVRKEILGSMDYYSTDPAFKAKVDSLIDSQPLSQRSNSALVMNAYKTAVYDHLDQIKEGKIKSQASLASNASSGTGGYIGSKQERQQESDELSPEEKIYARKLGIPEKDWASTRRELEYV